MSLLNDELSVWEIGFRWSGYDPLQARLRLPLGVRDNFRIMMDAVLSIHLECLTLSNEKYEGSDPDEAKMHIRYWLDDVYACIEGRRFNKQLLMWARIERWKFKRWCERRNIPLPEFWFPSGWAIDYQWDEEVFNMSDPANEDSQDDSGPSEQFKVNQRIKLASQLASSKITPFVFRSPNPVPSRFRWPM